MGTIIQKGVVFGNDYNDAIDVKYDNTDSNLNATDVQSAITELDDKTNTFQGATTTADGISGIVPPPSKEHTEYFLKADGTWSSAAVPYLKIVDGKLCIIYEESE